MPPQVGIANSNSTQKLNLTEMKSETDLKREGSPLKFGESIQEGDTHIHVVCLQ